MLATDVDKKKILCLFLFFLFKTVYDNTVSDLEYLPGVCFTKVFRT